MIFRLRRLVRGGAFSDATPARAEYRKTLFAGSPLTPDSSLSAGQPAHSEASDAEGRTVTDTKIQNAYDKQRPSILRAGLSILCDFLLAFGLAVNPNRMR